MIKEEEAVVKIEATKFEWLEWFYAYADFGPADSDVRHHYQKEFERRTGKLVPKDYRSDW